MRHVNEPFGPLPPGAHSGNTEVRMRTIPCPKCQATLRAHDVEVLPDGCRLICNCGLDVLRIYESPDASNY